MTLRTLLVKLGFKGDVSQLVNFDKKITGLKSNIISLSAAFAGLTASLGYFLHEAAKLEQTKVAFETMAGSVASGQKLVKDLFKFARTTPFQIKGVLEASRILLGGTVAAKDMTGVLTELGHVAAGLDVPLNSLAAHFAKVKANTYLTGMEMENFRRLGVPLTRYLSDSLNKSEKDILRMIRRKEVSFDMFYEGWKQMVHDKFPNLMGRLLLTFYGITSNIKDYIYEIVAFSGEELLPIAKLIANQVASLLDSSRELIGLKFKQFFGGVSSAVGLLNKLFVRMYFRTREITSQLGGFNRLFKIFAGIVGAMVGVKSLALLGKLGKMSLGLLSMGTIKLMLLGGAMLLILGITEDIFGYLSGKESRIEKWLDWIEERFPKAFEHIRKWLNILKKEIEGFTLTFIGLFEGMMTGDWSMAKAGLAQISEAYNMIKTPVRTTQHAKDVTQKIAYPTMPLRPQTMAEKPIVKTNWLENYMVYQYPKKDKKKESLLNRQREWLDELFFPGGVPAVSGGEGILGSLLKGTSDKSLWKFPGSGSGSMNETFRMLEEAKEKESKSRDRYLRNLKNMNINTTLKISDLPKNANSKEVAEKLGKVIEPIVKKALDNKLTSEFSEVERKTK